ncbi:MAG: hypothetical protein GC206_13360 [Alphaproteobacteria bacterium]|nr:hypothetical protein [Alphaproteobacteria bacterium]
MQAKAGSGKSRASTAKPRVTAPARKIKKTKIPPPPQSSIWPRPPRVRDDALTAALAQVGAQLAALGPDLAREAHAAATDPILAHLVDAPEIYACCGGIDIATTKAQTFARIARSGASVKLSVYYREGRDLIEALGAAAQAAMARAGWETRGTFAREKPSIHHAQEFGSGTWGATMVLHQARAPETFAGRLSARERARETILIR